jgi:hypothetical protein
MRDSGEKRVIVTSRTKPEEFDQQRWSMVDRDRFFVAWRGAVYEPGLRLGTPTIEKLIGRLEAEPFGILCRRLQGIFVLFAFDRLRASWNVAVDNAGLYHAFYDGTSVSTSLLQLSANDPRGVKSISPRAVAEFLAHRGVHWRETLIKGIRTIGRDDILELNPTNGGRVRLSKSAAEDLEPSTPDDLTQLFAHLAQALEGASTSVDLTPGFDSRLVACLLRDQGAEFETAMSGWVGVPHVDIARRAASLLGCPFFFTEHNPLGLEDALDDLFYQQDGLSDLLGYHRMAQLQGDRQKRGVEIAVSGSGGELFKDFFWLQDFPHYRSAKTNFERLYDLRIAPVRLPDGVLTDETADAYRHLRADTLSAFEAFRSSINTESYDRVFYFYRLPIYAGADASANINNYIPFIAPLMDSVVFRLGISLPRRKRLFNSFHRELITRTCPGVASLKTDSGVTSHASVSYVARDLLGYASQQARALTDKMTQRRLGRTHFYVGADAPGFEGPVKRSRKFQTALKALRDAGFVRGSMAVEDVPDNLVGRLLTIGMLVLHVEGELRDQRPPSF